MYYVLDGHVPRPVSTAEEWARTFENADRIVAQTTIGEAFVSTVFLGIDHSWDGREPILFETMIFGGSRDQWQDRCSTWEQAETMHERACKIVYDDLPAQAMTDAIRARTTP